MIYVFAKDNESFKREMAFPVKNVKFIKNSCSIKGTTITEDDILYFTDNYKENPNYNIELVRGVIPTIHSNKVRDFFLDKFVYLIKGAPKMDSLLNKWFLAQPEERQAVLREDKWMLAEAAYKAGRSHNLDLLRLVNDAYNQGPDPRRVRNELDKIIDYIRETISQG